MNKKKITRFKTKIRKEKIEQRRAGGNKTEGWERGLMEQQTTFQLVLRTYALLIKVEQRVADSPLAHGMPARGT